MKEELRYSIMQCAFKAWKEKHFPSKHDGAEVCLVVTKQVAEELSTIMSATEEDAAEFLHASGFKMALDKNGAISWRVWVSEDLLD